MKAEIISIGDELLIGQVVNTNASWLAENLNLAGIKVSRISVLPDDANELLSGLSEALERSDLIIATGGLGPTKDDITKNVLCQLFGSKLVMSQEILKEIEIFFSKRGYILTEENRKQAEIPDNCIPLHNSIGTAPGLWFEKENKIFVSVPGVPFEMKELFTNRILPRLNNLGISSFIMHKTILTQGLGESFLAGLISNWEDHLPANLKLAYLPQPGIVRLRLTAEGNDKTALSLLIKEKIEELKVIIGKYIFGYDNDTLESIVGSLLKNSGKTLSTAESCTGGYIAHLITSVPGSSEYFKGSVITYANEIKTGFLDVKVETLIHYGAVSEETVIQMAENIRKKFRTDYAVAVSGIAGPDGGTEEKPVGTVWIAIATPGKTLSKKFLFGDNRLRNIQRASLTALNLLRINIR